MQTPLILISHKLCPYVQRAAILLEEKQADYKRRDVDLGNKPDWFLDISPLGKTPVLLVDNHAIFESAVICEYLDETIEPRLHPQNVLHKARNRSWIEFGSSILDLIAGFYSAPDEKSLLEKHGLLKQKFAQLETVIEGPYFNGEDFSLVDAVFAPVFRYFDVFEQIIDLDFFARVPAVRSWRRNLAQRRSVSKAVVADYEQQLKLFLIGKNAYLGRQVLIEVDRHARVA